ncbi:MAG: FtsX-like permease family protein [Pseudomonadota bacterium]
MPPTDGRDLHTGTLLTLFRIELGAGILGLRLFIGCVAVAAFMLGAIWMLGSGVSDGLAKSGLRILGGNVAITVPQRPLDEVLVARLAETGTLSSVVELRTAAQANGIRAPVELKAVDGAYPLLGSIGIADAESLERALAVQSGRPGAVVEPSFLSRFDAKIGDTLTLGADDFEIRGLLTMEPDRLSSGRFLVGPRVLIDLAELEATGLVAAGSLADYRYRLRAPPDMTQSAFEAAVRELTPDRGWELHTPADAADRVRRTVDRTTTFLGVSGIVALAIGLAGAWAAVMVWISRRARTIALYRLSGASVPLVVALHGAIAAIAAFVGLVLGLGAAFAVGVVLVDRVADQLHLGWSLANMIRSALEAGGTLVLGLLGACTAALSAAARIAPGSAMRSGDAMLYPYPRHIALGLIGVALSITLAVVSLPVPGLALVAAAGLAAVAALLVLGGWALARFAARRKPRGFIGLATALGLAAPGAAAIKALSIGIGIAGITAIVAAQNSLEMGLRAELPERIPDLVLIDIQPDQVPVIRARIEQDPALGGLQSNPFMRANILAVNGRPAADALVNPDKDWVIDGDRSFSWTAEPTGAELLAGEWWPVDYAGDPLISAEEDAMEAFNLKPGDRITYSVLGRTFTSEVVNIRKEYHRTFRPEYLLVATPVPFRNAPHSWIMSLQGDNDAAVDALIMDVTAIAPNVTSIDVRRIVSQVTAVIDGALYGSLVMATILLVAGALSLAAVVSADADARRREALSFILVGASRGEIALARFAEALAVGLLAAVVGGIAGFAGGLWLVDEALRVAWAPGYGTYILPAMLGLIAALAACAVGGLGAIPRGRGQLARYLAN